MNIYALSSGKGPSGIAIIRISGPDVYNICKQITKLKEIKSENKNELSLDELEKICKKNNIRLLIYDNLCYLEKC